MPPRHPVTVGKLGLVRYRMALGAKMKRLKKWFNGLKVSQKLMLISIVFMIPDSVMLYLFITSINENIHFAKLEQVGNEYQRPLERLLQPVLQHRLLARRASTGEASQALATATGEIDSAFDALQQVDARIGGTLGFTSEGLAKRNRQGCDVASVRQEWEWLKSEMGGLDARTRDQRHLQLIADIRKMIAHAGDMSNLILDPELDSYYLMDSTLMSLPQTQDRLAQVMADGEDFLKGSQPPVGQGKVTLAIDLTLLKNDDLDRITSSMQAALNNGNPLYGYSAGFHAHVPGVLKQYADAAQHFDDLTAKIQNGGTGDVRPDEYLAAGQAALDASFKLWFVADQELDGILQNRINYYVMSRTRSLSVSASALLAAILLVTFITRSISGPLKQQALELKLEIKERKQTEAELQITHAQLLTLSRQAGMAEVATGVLHNVGNVLNSVNVSSTLIAGTLRKLRLASLSKIAALLGEHEQDLVAFMTADSRGKMLPGLLSQLAGHLTAEQGTVLKELDHLQKNIEHIKEIVNAQQAHASSAGFIEPLDLRELLETALRMNTASLDRHGIVILREFQNIPRVPADRHKVLQIFVNLITNARQAMKDRPEKTLTVGIQAISNAAVRVFIRDTGCGIASENMTRIFAHGFTTKTDGHGFGLHSSALAAQEMKGSLTVYSDGPETGAVFTLELPLLQSQVRAA